MYLNTEHSVNTLIEMGCMETTLLFIYVLTKVGNHSHSSSCNLFISIDDDLPPPSTMTTTANDIPSNEEEFRLHQEPNQ